MTTGSPGLPPEARDLAALLTEALPAAGLEAPGTPALISLGENAVFALGHDLVARVARTPRPADRAHREIAVARWLASHDFPAPRAAAGAVTVDGHPVTFWARLAPVTREPDTTDLAHLLRRLHALPAPDFVLPPREPLALVEPWLAHAPAAEREFLLDRRDRLAAAYGSLTPALPPGVIHGDALPRNVGVHGGVPTLLDLEFAAHDMRELDLALTPLAAARYGLTPSAPGILASVYGFDVERWPGYGVVRAVRELAATAWVAQYLRDNPAAATEFAHRVHCLRDGDLTSPWSSF